MKKRLFVDMHHQGLLESLVLLFENRLGWEIYTPKGIDWFDSDCWHIADCYGATARETAAQFLLSAPPTDGTETIVPYRGVSTFNFGRMRFDVIMATHYANIQTYSSLTRTKPGAKFITQYGNEWPLHPATTNLLSSTSPFPIPSHINRLFYHQEINQAVFKPIRIITSRRISSFVNALNINSIFTQDWSDFLKLESLLPEYKFTSYGGGCRDGSLSQEEMARKLNRSEWMVHFKSGGDGFGHVLHSCFACGIPVIYKGSQYKGKLGGLLLKHLETGIDVEIMGLEATASYILSRTNYELYAYQQRVLETFHSVVNYDLEQKEVESFLERLI